MDLALILVVLTAVTGVIWAIDSFFFASARKAKAHAEAMAVGGNNVQLEQVAVQEPITVEYARSFFPMLLVVLVLRSFVFEPFRIPSGSMMPTLLVGDFIVVSKFSYGVRLPVLNTKILDTGSPERGDVAVFRFPDNPSLDYIKRIVAVPGDRVKYVNKQLYVNGEKAALDYQGQFEYQDLVLARQGTLLVERVVPQVRERFSENLLGVEHQILINGVPNGGASGGSAEISVPEGMYFAMGDNRDNSNDSRFWGFVPEENLVGRAEAIWMNWDRRFVPWYNWWSWSSWVDFDRIGTSIQ